MLVDDRVLIVFPLKFAVVVAELPPSDEVAETVSEKSVSELAGGVMVSPLNHLPWKRA